MGDEIVVGICRFSFLGRSDWRAFRHDKAVSADRLTRIAAELYDEARLAARFRAFEAICLPSILAQDDPRFLFLVITSAAMPAAWRKRLQALCAPHDQVQLIVSDEPDLGTALAPALREAAELSSGRLWQFRLDDDDAIDQFYLARLRRHAARLADLDEAAVSTARGLAVALYPDRPVDWLAYALPFQSAGLALRLARPGASIFGFGHFALAGRVSHFVDSRATGALMLKWPSDSRPLDLDRLPPAMTRLGAAEFAARLAADFPFLAGLDFERLRPGEHRAPRPPRSV